MVGDVTKIHTPVLIVGAGFAGLSAALFLGAQGIKCLLVERRQSLYTHPRAHGINRRTMEVLRNIDGIEKELFAAARGAPNDWTIVVSENVASVPSMIINTKAMNDESRDLSPALLCSAGQDRIEPVLLKYAVSKGAEVCFSTSLESFEELPTGVEVKLADNITGEHYTVICDYLLAADGAGSGIRKGLGIQMNGPGVLTHAVSILFETDLESILKGNGSYLYYLRNSDFTGALVTCDNPRIGQLNIEYDPETQKIEDFTPEHCVKLITKALGIEDLDVIVHDTMPWRMAALVANEFSRGRIYLLGDAAHHTPPVGGLGGQGGIQDSDNLAWKLALVMKGLAGSDLLKTYEEERLPVAHLANARAIANYVERMRPDRQDIRIMDQEVDYLNVVFGYKYCSKAVITSSENNNTSSEDPCTPSSLPGFRLPHTNIHVGKQLMSIYDLIKQRFILIVGRDENIWFREARNEAISTKYNLMSYRIGHDINAEIDLHAFFNLTSQDALLIRPDAFIAWRGTHDCNAQPVCLEHVMNKILSIE
jgi:putative polyketide hydroxylase